MKSTSRRDEAVVVSRPGATFYTLERRDERNAVRAARGEHGITEGMMRHLVELGYHVVYFGKFEGEIEGVEHVPSLRSNELDGLDTWTKQQKVLEEDYQDLAAALGGSRVIASITVPAQSPSCCTVARVTPQITGMRRVAPQLYACHRLHQTRGAPRVNVVSDVRSYAQEQEMVTVWPGAMPGAILSMGKREFRQRILQARLAVTEVDAKVHTWVNFEHMDMRGDTELNSHERDPVHVFAHAHIGTGQKQSQRDKIWADVLSPLRDLARLGMQITGEGWEYWSKYESARELRRDMVRDLVHPLEMMSAYSRTRCSPVTSPGHGYGTSKPMFMAVNGCVPIFYGRSPDDEFTLDPAGEIYDLDSVLRADKPGELLDAVDYLENDACRKAACCKVREAFRPDYSVLDALLSWSAAGHLLEGQWGGYRMA